MASPSTTFPYPTLQETLLQADGSITFIRNSQTEERLSYAELLHTARQVLHGLHACGVSAGDEAVLLLEDPKDFLLAFWACICGGIIPVPLEVSSKADQSQKVLQVWATLKSPCLITQQKQQDRLFTKDNGLQLGKLQPSTYYLEELLATQSVADLHSGRLEDLAYIQFSSGSTGNPKGVMLTHGNLLTNTHDIIARSEITAEDVMLSWMPLTHDMGMICFHLSALVAGAHQYIMPTQVFIRNPILWMDKAHEHRASLLYSPNFGYHYFLSMLKPGQRANWQLEQVRLIYNGAEPILPKLCEEFAETLQPYGLQPRVMFPGYGMAEASVAVALPRVGESMRVHRLHREHLEVGQAIEATELPEVALEFVETGLAMDHTEIRVCGMNEEVLPDRHIGHVQIRGGNVTHGYYQNPAATEALLVEDGWIRTGDLGFLDQGRFTITGRAKNIIIINGQNYYPQDIERVVSERFPEFGLGKVVACSHKTEQGEALLLFLLFKPSLEKFAPKAQQVAHWLRHSLGVAPQHIIPLRQVPKTTSGKVQHFKLAKQFAEGAFDTTVAELAKLTDTHPQDVAEDLEGLVHRLFGISSVSPDAELSELGLSSLDSMRLVAHIQQELGVQVTISELYTAKNWAGLKALIASATPQNAFNIQPREEQEYYPLSDGQRRFWMLQQLAPDTTRYQLKALTRYNRPLVRPAVEAALTLLWHRHDSLRTYFPTVQGVPVQKVAQASTLPLNWQTTAQESTAVSQIRPSLSQALSLSDGPLIQFHVMQYPTGSLLGICLHHAIADGWSMEVLQQEFSAAYTAALAGHEATLPELPLDYKDLMVHTAERDTKKALNYWQQQLRTPLPKVALPFLKPNAADRAQQPGGASFALANGIEAYAQQHQVTPFAVLLTALAAPLGHYAQAEELMLGTDTSGRHVPGIEHQIGYHLNTLPLRLHVGPQESFLDRAKAINQTLLRAYEHQDVAYGELARLATTHAPTPEAASLFDILVLYQTVGQEEAFTMALEGHDAEAISLPRQGVMDLEFIFEPTPQGTDLRIRYNPERYQHTDCVQLGNFVQRTLAEGLSDNPAHITAEEASLLEGPTASDLGAGWLSLFEQTVATHGSRPALTDGTQHYTYAELAHTCKAWAGSLVTDFGINPGDTVAILVPPSAHLTVAFVSILMAGGTVLPIEYTYPSQRIHQLLTDGEAKVVITTPELVSEIPTGPWQTALPSDLEGGQAIALPLPEPGDLAYLMYTSGSTGTPKGVMISHGALTDYACTFAEYFQLSENDRFIQQSSCSFDVFIEEVFPTLAVGAEVVVAPRGGTDVAALLQLTEESQATFLSVTPGILAEMTQQPCPPTLRVVISGGESLKAWQLRDWYQHTQVYNTYGPTEATVCITYHPIHQPSDLAYLGQPLAGHTLKLVNSAGQTVPWGMPGEIWVSGPGLAKGYWKQEGLTEQAFIVQDGVRWYRTGDMGRTSREHGIQFLGRKDAQLKVRGYRIEPSEVENELLKIPGIEEAWVTATEKHRSQQLVAYLVGDASRMTIRDLRSELVATLPPQMVPSAWLWVDHLPRLVSGKVNVKALPPVEAQAIEEAVLPATREEEKLWAMFAELLPEEVTSIHQSFFLLGGNSLLAARLLNLIQGQWDAALTMRDLFTYNTVAELAQRVGVTAAQDTIPTAEAADHYPLSAAQTHLWVQQEFDSSGAAFHLPWQITLKSQAELPAFRQAWQYLMERHESLRTVYQLEAGLPVQVILPEDTALPFTSYSTVFPSGDQLQEVIKAPFALDYQPLFRIQVYDGPGTTVAVLLTFHHLAVDGWSMENLLAELATLLNGHPLPALPIRLRDMAVWQQTRSYASSQPYWEEKLAGERTPINLPADKPQHQVEGQDGTVLSFPIPATLIEQIEGMAQQEEATLFQGLLALWYSLFFKYTGQQDQVIATTANGRSHQEIEPLVGYFIRTLPLRTQLQADQSFAQILRAAKETAVEALTHQDFPVEQWLREEARTTEGLFDILLIVQNFGERKAELPEAITGVKALDTNTSLNDLLIEYHQFGGVWECKIRFRSERFSESRIRRMVNHFMQLAQATTAAPTQAISQFPIVTTPEEDQILKVFNPTLNVQKTTSIWEQFSAQAITTPQATAVAYGQEQVSYHTLHQQATYLAGFLADQSLPAGSVVAILMERSPDALAVLLACLQAGVAFTPIDPNYPAARIALQLEDSGAQAVIVDGPGKYPHEMTVWQLSDMLSQGTLGNPKLTESDLAYLLYTSGTTGRPKGVRISRGALQDYVTTFSEYFQISSTDKVIQQSSLSFDIFVEEIFPALVSGATVVMVPNGGQDVDALAATIRQHEATVLSTTPLVIETLNEQYADLPSLRILISGGDVLHPHQISEFPASVRLFNTYGPTETTVCASYHPIVDRKTASLIGKPLPHHQLYILLPDGGLAPIGIPGELCIAGAGLADGYHHREQETADRFVPNPFIPGTKMYRTGDMAQWQADGNVAYLGRRDEQLKIRGYRVEPQELAQAALTHPGVQQAHVLVESVGGIPQLILFVSGATTFDTAPLKTHLQNLLPHYLNPAAIVAVPSIPQNAHGKTDAQALRKAYQQQKVKSSVEGQPMTELEEQIAQAYATILGMDRPGRDDHFLALGGHSIKAVQVANLLKQEIDLPLTSADILQYPTPESLALALTARQPESNTIAQREEQEHYPLSAVQNQMWLLSQLEAEQAAYNITTAYRTEGKFDTERWNQALSHVLRRHQSLRSRVRVIDETPRWVICDIAETFNTPVLAMPTQEGLQIALDEAAQKPFQLEKESLLRATVYASDTEWVLVLSLHHIIADGWSVRVLSQELVEAYEQGMSSASAKYQFYDFYTPPTEQPDAVQFWKEELQAPLPVLELATDHPRPAIKTANGEVLIKTLPSNIMHGSMATQAGGTFGMAWCALQTYLWRATGRMDFTIGSPVALRESPALEDQIGCYLNTVVYRSQLSLGLSAEALAQRVATQLNRVREHQTFPFNHVVDAVQPDRDLSRSPLFDVMLVLHNQTEHQQWATQLQGGTITELTPTAIKTKVDLTFNLHLVPQGYELRLEYNRDLFTHQRIAYLAEGFVTLWQAMAQNPQAQLSTLPIHGKAEARALAQWQQGPRLPKSTARALDGIYKQVATAPTARAVYDGAQTYTYQELWNRAEGFAQQLQQNQISSGDRVGVLLPRTADMLAVLLGILRCGATYVPIDLTYPQDRITYMVADSEAKLLVTTPALSERVPKNTPTLEVSDTSFVSSGAFESTSIDPGQAAYLIYTSGSTGQPKGVVISHGNLDTFLAWCQQEYAEDRFEEVWAVTSYCFDLSIFEFFYTLYAGKTIRVLENGISLTQELPAQVPTLINTVPSVVDHLLKSDVQWGQVTTLNMAGEPIPQAIVKQLQPLPIALRNLYGPSEDTTYSTCYRISDTDIYLGSPVGNTTLELWSPEGTVVPIGSAGEIVLSGDKLSQGYWNRPTLTAEMFIGEHPKKYRTGDLARWTTEGQLVFLGRTDHQVKIRGHRIELGEIEKVLNQVSGIQQFLLHPFQPEEGSLELALYYVGEAHFSEEVLYQTLQAQLPGYMVPGHFVPLTAFPLTPNGKVDRKQLPKPNAQTEPQEDQAWQGDELRLAQLWSEVLGTQNVSPKDHFFRLGGNSLSAVRLAHRLTSAWDKATSLQLIFQYPVLRDLAQQLNQEVAQGQQTDFEEQDHYPVTSIQNRLWVLQQIEQTVAYTMPGAYRISGAVDVEKLHRAYVTVAAQYNILRTQFMECEGALRQKVATSPDQSFEFSVREYQDLSEIQSTLHQAIQRPFTLTGGPLWRIDLWPTDAGDYVMLITMHHIISDGWSMDLLNQAVVAAYQGEDISTPLQYHNFALWEQEYRAGLQYQKDQAYWTRVLSADTEPLDLPADHIRPPKKTYSVASHRHTLSAETSAQIRSWVRKQGTTDFRLLTALTQVLLYKYTGHDHLHVGVPFAGRSVPAWEQQLGCFVNTNVLPLHLQPTQTLEQVVQQVADTLLATEEHQQFPFEHLIDQLDLPRDLSRSPLFDVMVAMEVPQKALPSVSGIDITPIPLADAGSKYDLTLTFGWDDEERLTLSLVFNPDVVQEWRMEAMAQHWEILAMRAMATSHTPVQSLHYLSGQEQTYLQQLTPAATPLPQDTVLDLLRQRVQKAPKQSAVRFQGTTLSFEALDTQSNGIAHALVHHYGISSGERVGLYMDRSSSLVPAIWGILKAGAAYVPLDPEYPEDRIRFMAEDSQIKLVLTNGDLNPTLSLPALDVTTLSAQPQGPVVPVGPEQTAYIIYTSGTTGQPKGVAIHHQALYNLCHWFLQDLYAQHQGTVVSLLMASISFDSSIKQLFAPTLSGGTLVLISNAEKKDPAKLFDILVQERVTVLDLTPSYLHQLIQADAVSQNYLQYVLLGGEKVVASLVADFQRCFGPETRLINLYGVTEATVDSTWAQLSPSLTHVEGVGTPITNTEVWVMNADGQPTGIGIPGEIWLAGMGVAHGYLNRPELTQEKFITLPQTEEQRAYRTGDYGYWTRQGSLIYLGRKDNQVKVRGYRIELHEIENQLLGHAEIKGAHVMVYQDDLAAYIQCEESLSPEALKQHLRQHLPEFMVPAYLVKLTEFPLRASGKLDSNRLPDPMASMWGRPLVANNALTPTEQEVHQWYSTILELDAIDTKENFFEIGGNSLKAIALHRLISNVYPGLIEVHELFSHPRLGDLAALIEERTVPNTLTTEVSDSSINIVDF